MDDSPRPGPPRPGPHRISPDTSAAPSGAAAFPARGGATGEILRARDWAATPLGPAEDWPPLLRAMVATCLASPAPMALCWGAAGTLFYNDAFVPVLGPRHPDALGASSAGPAGRDAAPEPPVEPGFAPVPAGWELVSIPIEDGSGLVAGMLHRATPAAPPAEAGVTTALAAAGMLGGWDWDLGRDRVVADAAIARAHGVDPVLAANGLPVATFTRSIHPDDLPRLSAAVERALQTGEAFAEEYRIVGGREGERRILGRGRPVRDATGRAERLPGTAFAVERPRGEGEGAASRSGLARQILDSAVDYAIVATDLDGRITRWNDGAERVFGWTEREMIGRTADRLFTAGDRAAGRPRVEMELARSEGGGDDERWHVRKGGARFWAHGRMTPLRDDDGGPAGYVKVLRDETAQKRQGQRLQLLARASAGLLGAEQPDDVLNAVLDASAGLVEFDQSHSFGITADGRHLRLLHSSGTSPGTFEALQFTPFADVLCGIVAESRRPLVLRDLQDSTDPRHESSRRAGLQAYAGYPIRARDKLFGVLSFGSFRRAAFDAETLSFFRTLAHYVSIVHDRADRDAALRALNATLEQQVEARTTELMSAEAALRQSQKMEAVGQLTGGLAHDFNNLLTGIGGSLEVLGMRVAQGRVADLGRYIDAAEGAARRAAALTHRLLAFSRRQTLDPTPTDVGRLVAGMAELVRRTVGPSIAVEPVAADDLWTTLVDASQLENALLNLCINARDAMPDGGRLVIETGNRRLDRRAARDRDLPAGPYVTLCVSDDGAGMTAEVAARAFDPFFTTKPIGQGTGLGLSMIYGFARQSGGQVRIHSEPGRGTTVCLYLPRHHGAVEAPAAPETVPHASRAAQDETVLVVDDEPTIRMLVVEVLEELGYNAIEAEDGASGLAVMQSGARIDLLVTDVGLPGGLNGRQMADAGRAIRPGLRVLFITGYAENAVLSHGHLEPGMQVMTKPFAMADLATRIRELIAGG